MKVCIVSNSSTKYLLDKFSEKIKSFVRDLKFEVFSDNEMSVKFIESVRDYNVYILGSSSDPRHFMELLLTIDAARRSSAKSITVILPYYGYGRQDKRESRRGCLGAKVIAKVLDSMKIDKVITIDLHAEQIEGFFDATCDPLHGHSFLLNAIKERVTENTILASPDAGGGKRVEKYCGKLGLQMVTMNKTRKKPNEVASMELFGDVNGKDVILIDDIVDTCGTLIKSVSCLKEKGAKKVIFVATHPVLSGPAYKNLDESGLDEMIITDTIPVVLAAKTKITIVSCVPYLEKIILNLIASNPISELNEH